ncbi:MAG: transposase [Candidatus Rokuibacteriota bacterium]
MCLSRAGYRPRTPEQGVLHTVVRTHLEAFLREAADRTGGAGLPRFVEDEFREFLTCGILAHGLARLRCEGCGLDRLLPFSCKGRGFCPSCGGRRMTERAAHAVDAVVPPVPVRQWVLSLPHWLRYVLAWDHGLCRAVLAVYVRALLGFQRWRARRLGFRDGRSGSLTVVQRFGGALNLNIHFHTLVLDGVFTNSAQEGPRFHPTPPPADAEVTRLLSTIRTRILRLLARRGLGPDTDVSRTDPVAEESPALAGLSSASVQGRVALGPRVGARVMALGRDPEARWVASGGPRHAHLEGFDLHANVAVDGENRERLEQLCRYLLRPAVAQDRIRLTDDGRVVLELKAAWADGTNHLVFEPRELLARLAALTPRPRINLVFYHGVLAPNARWRAAVVTYGAVPAVAPAPTVEVSTGTDASGEGGAASRPTPRGWTWAQLMRRAFDLDVLVCPACGGRLRLIATILDRRTIRAILLSRGLPTEAEAADRAPPAQSAFTAPQASAGAPA